MKIIILGAGQVGASVAESLVSEANDITLVDLDQERLRYLQDRFDLRTVRGDASHPSTLKNAGADDADMIIAVTQSDPTNLVACKVAKRVFNVPLRIARLRSADFLESDTLLGPDDFAVDFALCPEQVITRYIGKLVDFPEALQVVQFGHGRITLVGVRAISGGLLVGKQVREMRAHLPAEVDARITAIFRGNQPIIPEGDTYIRDGDDVFVLAASEHIRCVLRELRSSEAPVRRIMIAGGGNIGQRVAGDLEATHRVKLIEASRERGEQLASGLSDTLVLSGDATDEDLLEQENIAEMDLFLALTNDDEDNIMAASLAKRLGCKRTLALINRRAYIDMVQAGPIDIAISPANISIGELLAYVRQGDVEQVHSLRRGAAEALELVVHGDEKTSKLVGRQVGSIDLPRGVTIAAILRDLEEPQLGMVENRVVQFGKGRVVIVHHDTVIESGDHVIVFCSNKKLVKTVEKLFQVGFHFF